MTIKNIKKNVSAEDEMVVTKAEITNATISVGQNENYSKNRVVKFTAENFFDETNRKTQTATLTIPLSELVRIGFLTANYYDIEDVDDIIQDLTDYINNKIKLKFEIVASKPSVAIAKEKQNYIFLKPFNANEDDPELHQEGDYIEYVYNQATETVEEVGSTRIDLRPYLTQNKLDNALNNSTEYTSTKTQVAINKANILSLQDSKLDVRQSIKNGILTTNNDGDIQVSTTIKREKISDFSHNHGLITNDGKIGSTAGKIVVTGNGGAVSVVDTIAASKVSLNNNNVADILTSVNSDIYNMINTPGTLSLYELKSDLRADVWGTAGFKSLQDAEPLDSETKNFKLGDYIYRHLYDNFYNKSDIQEMIYNIENLQNQILGIL